MCLCVNVLKQSTALVNLISPITSFLFYFYLKTRLRWILKMPNSKTSKHLPQNNEKLLFALHRQKDRDVLLVLWLRDRCLVLYDKPFMILVRRRYIGVCYENSSY